MGRTLMTAILWLTVASLIAGAGCAQSDDGSLAAPSEQDTSVQDTIVPWPEQVRSPSYGPVDPRRSLTRIDEVVGNTTTNLLERRDESAYSCLAERGFDFDTTAFEPVVPSDTREITQGEFAATWGFGVTTAVLGGGLDLSKVNTSEPSYVDMLDGRGIPQVPTVIIEGDIAAMNQANTALNDDTDERESCATEANKRLGLLDSGPFAAAAQLRRLVLDTYDNSAGLRRLSSTYESCMQAKGFADLRSPTEAFAVVKSGFGELTAGATAALVAGDPTAADPDAADADTRRAFEQLNRRELTLAEANLGCEGAFTPEALQLIDDIQRDILADNSPLLSVIQEAE